jgi:DNA-binding transcriptional LysR family regulator
MTLEQLRIFIAVAEREHVTQASRDLNLTQSATSAAVSTLEDRHQAKLFDRIGRRIVLTEAGKIFLSEARAVVARAQAAESVLADLSGLKRGKLTIAASQTVANYWLPQHIQRFQKHHPGITVTMTIGNTATVTSAIPDGAADLGLIEGDVDDPSLTISAIAEDEILIVVAPDHPWASQIPNPKRDFQQACWVLREPGSGTRAIFEAALPALGVDKASLDIVLELPSNESVRAAVQAGAGVTAMSRLVVANALAAGTLRSVKIALPPRQFFLLAHKERYQARAAQEFRHMVTELSAADNKRFSTTYLAV